jgi:hypothetical protein
MVRLAADENLNGAITRGVLRLNPAIDFVRIQDVGLSGITDPELLEWAAAENRVVISQDVTTLRKFAEDRVRAGLPMPGLIEVAEHLPIRAAIDDLLLIAECGVEGEFEGKVIFLPLR